MSDTSRPDVPWRTRLRAWWEGYDAQEYLEWRERSDGTLDNLDIPPGITLPKSMSLEELMEESDGDEAANQETGEKSREAAVYAFEKEENPDPVWPRARIEIAQRIFGTGFLAPGGAQRFIDAAVPLGLDPVQSVLDLSLGVGGPAAAISEKWGVWIDAYERNPALFEHAGTALKMLKGGDQVRPKSLDPDTVELPRKKYDVVLCFEMMHRLQDRISLMGKIRNSMKDWGQLLLSDYVLPGDDEPSDRVMGWVRRRREPITLWTRQQYEVALSNCGLDLRVVRDESEEHGETIRTAFAQFVSTLNANKSVTQTPIGRAALMKVAEDWSRLATLLQRGELQLLRFTALKPGE